MMSQKMDIEKSHCQIVKDSSATGWVGIVTAYVGNRSISWSEVEYRLYRRSVVMILKQNKC